MCNKSFNTIMKFCNHISDLHKHYGHFKNISHAMITRNDPENNILIVTDDQVIMMDDNFNTLSKTVIEREKKKN